MTGKKRRYGTGSITMEPSGRARARIRLSDGTRPTVGTYATWEEAAGVLNAINEHHQGQPLLSTGEITLRGFGPGFLDRRELAGIRNIGDERNRWKRIEEADFVDYGLGGITPKDVRDWLDKLRRTRSERTKRPLAIQTVKNILNLLRAALNDAVEQNLIVENPAKDVRVPKRLEARSNEPWTYLQPPEQAKLIKTIGERDKPAVAFAIGTGLRQSEQWQLRLADVHVDGPDPHVVVRYSRGGRVTKNGKIRRVPLFGLGLRATREQLAALQGKKNARGLLFPNTVGNARSGQPSSYKRAVKACKFGRGVRWHDLRHTAASALLSGWWERRWALEEVQAFLGHTDIKSTQRYAHLAESALKKAARETTGVVEWPVIGPDEAASPLPATGTDPVPKP